MAYAANNDKVARHLHTSYDDHLGKESTIPFGPSLALLNMMAIAGSSERGFTMPCLMSSATTLTTQRWLFSLTDSSFKTGGSQPVTSSTISACSTVTDCTTYNRPSRLVPGQSGCFGWTLVYHEPPIVCYLVPAAWFSYTGYGGTNDRDCAGLSLHE
ncbi:hypothetical protein BJX76DRAFT_344226 [Aspergillus varians]